MPLTMSLEVIFLQAKDKDYKMIDKMPGPYSLAFFIKLHR